MPASAPSKSPVAIGALALMAMLAVAGIVVAFFSPPAAALLLGAALLVGPLALLLLGHTVWVWHKTATLTGAASLLVLAAVTGTLWVTLAAAALATVGGALTAVAYRTFGLPKRTVPPRVWALVDRHPAVERADLEVIMGLHTAANRHTGQPLLVGAVELDGQELTGAKQFRSYLTRYAAAKRLLGGQADTAGMAEKTGGLVFVLDDDQFGPVRIDDVVVCGPAKLNKAFARRSKTGSTTGGKRRR